MNHDSNIILQYVYKYKLLINRGTTIISNEIPVNLLKVISIY